MEGRAASVPDHDPETSEVHIPDGLDAMLSRFCPHIYFARDIRPCKSPVVSLSWVQSSATPSAVVLFALYVVSDMWACFFFRWNTIDILSWVILSISDFVRDLYPQALYVSLSTFTVIVEAS